MKGLRIAVEQDDTFASTFRVMEDELAKRYWLIESQGGPFSITDKPNFWELDRDLDNHHIELPNGRWLWRPKIFPRFSSMLVVSEWTTLIGLDAPEEDAIRSANKITEISDVLTNAAFELLQGRGALVFLYPDESVGWEIYGDDSLMNHLRQSFPKASDIDSDHWEETKQRWNDGWDRTKL